jgi:hypothetical protein
MKGTKEKRWEQIDSSTHNKNIYGSQQREEDNGDQDVVQRNIKFASLKVQSLSTETLLTMILSTITICRQVKEARSSWRRSQKD